MLSDEDKREMLEDAKSDIRRHIFARARQKAISSMTWAEYFSFLKSVQNMFPQNSVSKLTLGASFKL